jgi:hypothetical protein
MLEHWSRHVHVCFRRFSHYSTALRLHNEQEAHIQEQKDVKVTFCALQDVLDVMVLRSKRKGHQAELQRKSPFFVLQKGVRDRAGDLVMGIHADATFDDDDVCLIQDAAVNKLSPAYSYLHPYNIREKKAFQRKRKHSSAYMLELLLSSWRCR